MKMLVRGKVAPYVTLAMLLIIFSVASLTGYVLPPLSYQAMMVLGALLCFLHMHDSAMLNQDRELARQIRGRDLIALGKNGKKAVSVAVISGFVIIYVVPLSGYAPAIPWVWLQYPAMVVGVLFCATNIRQAVAFRRNKEAVQAARAAGKTACRSCGYWLGSEQQACPECGEACPDSQAGAGL